jgi:hypothetical protein
MAEKRDGPESVPEDLATTHLGFASAFEQELEENRALEARRRREMDEDSARHLPAEAFFPAFPSARG